MEEIWKDIQGWEGFYQVSSFGNFKSLERKTNHYKAARGYSIRKEKIIKPFFNDDGYLMVDLSVGDKRLSISAHRLVAMAFIKQVDINRQDVNHKNGIKMIIELKI